MAGINLSQGISETSRVKRSMSIDTGFVFSIILILVVLGAWGGIYYFLRQTNSQIAALDQQVADSDSVLRGEKVDRVAAFDFKRQNLEQGFESHLDIAKNLSDLESLIVPDVRLTKYEYDHSTGASTIEGVTSDYKYLAQELISLKKQSQFTDVRVTALSNTESGGISFTLKSEGQLQSQ